jgi:lysophospholipase L1-like esterase
MKRLLIVALLVTACGSTTAPSTARAIRLVTLGDSLTAVSNPCGAGWPTFLTLPLAYFYNAGIGGHTSGRMLGRLTTDVLAHNPTDVTIMAGSNDITTQQTLASSMANMSAIIDGVRGAGAIAWVLTIPPMEPRDAPWANPTSVVAYNNALRDLASKHGAHLIDTAATVSDANNDWASTTDVCDAVHPTDAGAALIAAKVQSTLLAAVTP